MNSFETSRNDNLQGGGKIAGPNIYLSNEDENFINLTDKGIITNGYATAVPAISTSSISSLIGSECLTNFAAIHECSIPNSLALNPSLNNYEINTSCIITTTPITSSTTSNRYPLKKIASLSRKRSCHEDEEDEIATVLGTATEDNSTEPEIVINSRETNEAENCEIIPENHVSNLTVIDKNCTNNSLISTETSSQDGPNYFCPNNNVESLENYKAPPNDINNNYNVNNQNDPGQKIVEFDRSPLLDSTNAIFGTNEAVTDVGFNLQDLNNATNPNEVDFHLDPYEANNNTASESEFLHEGSDHQIFKFIQNGAEPNDKVYNGYGGKFQEGARQKFREQQPVMTHVPAAKSSTGALPYHAQQKDTTFTKIFVGGLPYHTTDDSLRTYFEVFGDIEEAVVITDRQTGKSRGYGFVTMTERTEAERAVKEPNPIIDGRKANVNLAYIGAKPRANGALNSLLMNGFVNSNNLAQINGIPVVLAGVMPNPNGGGGISHMLYATQLNSQMLGGPSGSAMIAAANQVSGSSQISGISGQYLIPYDMSGATGTTHAGILSDIMNDGGMNNGGGSMQNIDYYGAFNGGTSGGTYMLNGNGYGALTVSNGGNYLTATGTGQNFVSTNMQQHGGAAAMLPPQHQHQQPTNNGGGGILTPSPVNAASMVQVNPVVAGGGANILQQHHHPAMVLATNPLLSHYEPNYLDVALQQHAHQYHHQHHHHNNHNHHEHQHHQLNHNLTSNQTTVGHNIGTIDSIILRSSQQNQSYMHQQHHHHHHLLTSASTISLSYPSTSNNGGPPLILNSKNIPPTLYNNHHHQLLHSQQYGGVGYGIIRGDSGSDNRAISNVIATTSTPNLIITDAFNNTGIKCTVSAISAVASPAVIYGNVVASRNFVPGGCTTAPLGPLPPQPVSHNQQQQEQQLQYVQYYPNYNGINHHRHHSNSTSPSFLPFPNNAGIGNNTNMPAV